MRQACEYLITKAYPAYDPKTCGQCARAVRSAVDFDLGKEIPHTESAKDYGACYEKVGFKKVFSYPAQKKEDYQPEVGDISIIQPVKIIIDDKEVIQHPNGHICMLTQKGWISDFVQGTGGSMLPLAAMYGGTIRNKDPQFDIYRYASA